MKKIFKILLFVAPFPLFIDAGDLSFFIYLPPIGDLDAMHNTKPSIPLPIVTFSLFLLLSAGAINVVNSFLKINVICKMCRGIATTLVIVYAIIFALLEVNIKTIIQVLMGFLLISSLQIISERRYLNSCAKFYLSGIAVWLSMHTLSMLYYNNFSLIGIDRNWNFPIFFGIYIYQSLVSYAAIPSIFLIFSLFMYMEKGGKKLSIIALLLSGLVGFISETRLFVIDYLMIIAIFLMFHRCANTKILSLKTLKVKAIIMLIVLLMFGANFYTKRVVQKGAQDRFELISMGLNEITEKSSLILWGSGAKHSYAHNYFIDFILNYGFLALLLLLIALLYNVYNISRKIDFSKNLHVYILMLLAVSITNSTFNTAITQLLFLGNLVVALTILLSYGGMSKSKVAAN